MKKAFFVNGGAGRVLCTIPAFEHYKTNVDPSVVIVAESWLELFFTSPILRDNVYPLGHKGLFNDKLIDREIVSPEPYRLNAYFNQKCNLIQAFDMLINENTDDIPETKPFSLEISKNDQAYGYNLISQVKKQTNKDKVIVFQPLGSGARRDGMFLMDESGRSFELKDIIAITKELTKHYAVVLMSNVEIPVNENMGAAIPDANLLQWMGIVNAADYFLGCDSMGQHYAHALGKPATVVIGSTFPENISYPDNKDFTIIDNGLDKRMYSPFRVTQDFTAERNNEDLMVMDDKMVNSIIKSVTNRLGKTSQKPTASAKKPFQIENAAKKASNK